MCVFALLTISSKNMVSTSIKVYTWKELVSKSIKRICEWSVHDTTFWVLGTWKKIFGVCVLESPCAKKNRRKGVRQQLGILHGTFEVESRGKRWGNMKTLLCGPSPKGVEMGKHWILSYLSYFFSIPNSPWCLLVFLVCDCV